MSCLGPRLTDDNFTKRELDWQQNAVADRKLDGKMVAFIRDRTATRMPTPVKLPPRSSFEVPQLKVMDDPCLMEGVYEESGVTGTLWQPLGTITKQPMTVPQMLALPNIGFKILHAMGGRVMPQ
jgi:hypothetical protein